ncbi:hypothetical protein ACWIDW_04845 [Microbacterium sp. NPDC055312]
MTTLTFPTLSAINRRPGHALSLLEDITESGITVHIEDIDLTVIDTSEQSTAIRLTLEAIEMAKRNASSSTGPTQNELAREALLCRDYGHPHFYPTRDSSHA